VAALAEEMIEAVAAQAQATLQGHDHDVEKAIRSLLTASSEWPQKFSQYRRLTGYLEVGRLLAHGARAEGLQPRLEKLLAAWARPLVPLGRVAALSSAELYAVILAPAVCDTTCPVSLAPGKSGGDWLEFLSSAAVNAIVPPKKKRKPKTEQGPSFELAGAATRPSGNGGLAPKASQLISDTACSGVILSSKTVLAPYCL
jgi:hypothetical protein